MGDYIGYHRGYSRECQKCRLYPGIARVPSDHVGPCGCDFENHPFYDWGNKMGDQLSSILFGETMVPNME